MTKAARKEAQFLSGLLEYREDAEHLPETLQVLRRKGAEEVRRIPFPHPKDEDWRFTDMRDLYRNRFQPAPRVEVEPADLREHFIPESGNSRMVFVNGAFSPRHSDLEGLPDSVTIGNLASMAGEHPEQVGRHLNRYGDFEGDPFSSFNNAFLEDGAFIHIPENVKVSDPVQLLFIQTDAPEPFFTTSRVVIAAEEDSEITIVEQHIGLSDNLYFTLPVVEVNLERRAFVKHTKIQHDSRKAVHIARTAAHVRTKSDYESYTISLGAKLSRYEPRISQMEEDVTFTVDGLVLIDDDQISDTHSVMDHRFPTAKSHQLHKCVINGSAHSIFNGKIFVRRDAQKIDSFQENRNLLLSRGGLVNTKPQLEIFADDVVCTHGATIGQLEEEEVFYLKSRGLSGQQSRELLTYAFALETIENITVESVQKLLVEEVRRFTNRQPDSELVA